MLFYPLYSFSLPSYNMIFVNISTTYIENYIRQCYNFCFDLKHNLENSKGEGYYIYPFLKINYFFFLHNVPRFLL